MAQPLKMSTLSEKDVKQQKRKGIRLTIDDMLLLAKGPNFCNMLKLLWRFKGQWKPLLDLFAKSK